MANVRFKKKNYQLTRQSILQYKTPICFIASSQIQIGVVEISLWERWVLAPSRAAQNKLPNPVAQVQVLSKTLEYAPCSSIPRASGTWSFHTGHLAKGGDNSKKEQCSPLPPSFLGSSGKLSRHQ